MLIKFSKTSITRLSLSEIRSNWELHYKQ